MADELYEKRSQSYRGREKRPPNFNISRLSVDIGTGRHLSRLREGEPI